MKHTNISLSVAAFIVCLLAGSLRAELSGTMVWNNQDQLEGKLVKISDKHLSWQTNLFEQPLEVDSDFVSHLTLSLIHI